MALLLDDRFDLWAIAEVEREIGSPAEVADSLVAIEGTSDLSGFPRRPRLRIRFFDPVGGQARSDEDPGELSVRLLAELRALVPPSLSYRKRAMAASA